MWSAGCPRSRNRIRVRDGQASVDTVQRLTRAGRVLGRVDTARKDTLKHLRFLADSRELLLQDGVLSCEVKQLTHGVVLLAPDIARQRPIGVASIGPETERYGPVAREIPGSFYRCVEILLRRGSG